jgi:hypothetical protein
MGRKVKIRWASVAMPNIRTVLPLDLGPEPLGQVLDFLAATFSSPGQCPTGVRGRVEAAPLGRSAATEIERCPRHFSESV